MKKILAVVLIFLGFLFVNTRGGSAQLVSAEPEFLFSWRSLGFSPPGFLGKAIPAANSPFIVSFELIENGSRVDLSNENVLWYLNGKFAGSGLGLQTFTFVTSPFFGIGHKVRAQINEFRGEGGVIAESIEIPTTRPEVIIENPYPESKFVGLPVMLRAVPYSFTVKSASELLYSWEVNGQTPSALDSPEELVIGSSEEDGEPPGRLTVGLTVENPANLLEVAGGSLNLFYSQ